jgi:polyphosphate kinase
MASGKAISIKGLLMVMKYKDESAADYNYTCNRELSWLKFNDRVLQLAKDPSVPLLERLKFVSIFTSNLDEFFMIRVGSLYDLSIIDESHIDNKSGMNVREQLNKILKTVAPMYENKDQAFSYLEDQLSSFGIERIGCVELEDGDKKFIERYFKMDILPVLVPQVIDAHHPFPHIENKSLHIAVMLKSKDDIKFGIIPVPKTLPRLVIVKNNGTRYILIEDIILKYADRIFDMYSIVEKTILSVTRNADINPDDEALDFEEDFRHHMKKILKRRARLSAVRLEIMEGQFHNLAEYLTSKLMIKKNQVFQSASPLDMTYVSALEDQLPIALRRSTTYPPYIARYPAGLAYEDSMIRQVQNKDILMHFPYECMDPFLNLIKESAVDPSVISIKISLYRLDKKSRLAEYLIDAAENNKDVTVIMELRARFDEKNNIEWAERLEESGCKVIYGFKSYKIHSKICLITLHTKKGMQYITQIGTGNYNEKTSKQYCDFSLLTSDRVIGMDANAFFKNMLISNLDGRYDQLLVAPSSFKNKIFTLIDQEMQKAQNDLPNGIILKLNSLTDRETIDKLSEASNAGVKIQLIIRGICCIVPGIKGKTENISVRSILGRYLEHARVYCFGSGSNTWVYISSADFMTRNVMRRIEIACPVHDGNIKEKILNILDVQLKENVKSWNMQSDRGYIANGAGLNEINIQDYLAKETANVAMTSDDIHLPAAIKSSKLTRLIRQFLTRNE